jgi:hypothetical protein
MKSVEINTVNVWPTFRVVACGLTTMLTGCANAVTEKNTRRIWKRKNLFPKNWVLPLKKGGRGLVVIMWLY